MPFENSKGIFGGIKRGGWGEGLASCELIKTIKSIWTSLSHGITNQSALYSNVTLFVAFSIVFLRCGLGLAPRVGVFYVIGYHNDIIDLSVILSFIHFRDKHNCEETR